MADEKDNKTSDEITRVPGAFPHLPWPPPPPQPTPKLLRPPIEYLLCASRDALEHFELTRLAHATNLRKEMKQIDEEARRAEIEAALARWLRKNRDELLRVERKSWTQIELDK